MYVAGNNSHALIIYLMHVHHQRIGDLFDLAESNVE